MESHSGPGFVLPPDLQISPEGRLQSHHAAGAAGAASNHPARRFYYRCCALRKLSRVVQVSERLIAFRRRRTRSVSLARKQEENSPPLSAEFIDKKPIFAGRKI